LDSAEQSFVSLAQLCEAAPRYFQPLVGVYLFRVAESATASVDSKLPLSWCVRLGAEPAVWRGQVEADCQVQLQANILREIIDGSLNPQLAFLDGRLKVSGDRYYVLRLQLIFELLAYASKQRAEGMM